MKSLERLIIRNGTLIIESLLRLVRITSNYGNKRTGYPPCDSLQIVGLILMGTRSHRDGLPAFPRQLDRERLGDDKDSGESEAECIELIIYLFVVV